MGNKTTPGGPDPVSWKIQFCEDYSRTLLNYGEGFLVAALVIGAVGAIVAAVAAFKASKRSLTTTESVVPVPGDPTPIIEAIKGLVESFSKAPIWLAMFGCGLLLMWMAGHAGPGYCNNNAPDPSGNASGGAGQGEVTETPRRGNEGDGR